MSNIHCNESADILTSLNIHPIKWYKLQKFSILYLKSILDIFTMAIALFQEESRALYFNGNMSCARVELLSYLKLNRKILKSSKGIFSYEIDFP